MNINMELALKILKFLKQLGIEFWKKCILRIFDFIHFIIKRSKDKFKFQKDTPNSEASKAPAIPEFLATAEFPTIPEPPATPESPATPEVPTTPEVPATPDSSATPEAPATPEAAVTPEAVVTLKAAVTPEAAVTSKAPSNLSECLLNSTLENPSEGSGTSNVPLPVFTPYSHSEDSDSDSNGNFCSSTETTFPYLLSLPNHCLTLSNSSSSVSSNMNGNVESIVIDASSSELPILGREEENKNKVEEENKEEIENESCDVNRNEQANSELKSNDCINQILFLKIQNDSLIWSEKHERICENRKELNAKVDANERKDVYFPLVKPAREKVTELKAPFPVQDKCSKERIITQNNVVLNETVEKDGKRENVDMKMMKHENTVNEMKHWEEVSTRLGEKLERKGLVKKQSSDEGHEKESSECFRNKMEENDCIVKQKKEMKIFPTSVSIQSHPYHHGNRNSSNNQVNSNNNHAIQNKYHNYTVPKHHSNVSFNNHHSRHPRHYLPSNHLNNPSHSKNNHSNDYYSSHQSQNKQAIRTMQNSQNHHNSPPHHKRQQQYYNHNALNSYPRHLNNNYLNNSNTPNNFSLETSRFNPNQSKQNNLNIQSHPIIQNNPSSKKISNDNYKKKQNGTSHQTLKVFPNQKNH